MNNIQLDNINDPAILSDPALFDLVDNNLYGLGNAHPELASRTGDYTLVMEDNHVIIDSLPGDNTPQLVGYHGGLSSQEVFVPLILVD